MANVKKKTIIQGKIVTIIPGCIHGLNLQCYTKIHHLAVFDMLHFCKRKHGPLADLVTLYRKES